MFSWTCLLGELLELAADAVGLRAAAADDDARPGGVDVDADAVPRALDLDTWLMPARSMPLDMQLADRHVLTSRSPGNADRSSWSRRTNGSCARW